MTTRAPRIATDPAAITAELRRGARRQAAGDGGVSAKMTLFRGELLTRAEIARRLGITPSALSKRLSRGESLEDATAGGSRTARPPRQAATADPATLAAELRQEIADAIAAPGHSQHGLTEATGIAQSGISRALAGATDPRLSTVVRLLAAVGCRLRVERADSD